MSEPDKYLEALKKIHKEMYKVDYNSDREEMNEALSRIFEIVIEVNNMPETDKTCDHRFSVVVEWINSNMSDGHPDPMCKQATKLACEKCGEVKEL